MNNEMTWDKHDNTLATEYLSDGQRAELFNFWFHGGEVEATSGKEEHWTVIKKPSWGESVVYRAKRTPRESFIYNAEKCRHKQGALSEDQMACAAYQLFNAGFQQPEDMK